MRTGRGPAEEAARACRRQGEAEREEALADARLAVDQRQGAGGQDGLEDEGVLRRRAGFVEEVGGGADGHGA